MQFFCKTILLSFLASVAFGDVHAIVPRGEGSDNPKHSLLRKLGQSKEFRQRTQEIQWEQEPIWDRHAPSYFRSVPSFQEEAQRAREVLLKTGLKQDKTFKVAHVKGVPAVFKSAVDRQKNLDKQKHPDDKRTIRSTYLEFISAQLAESMGMPHVVAPVAAIKEGGYEGILEKTIFLLSDAQKQTLLKATLKSAREVKTPLEKIHLALSEQARDQNIPLEQYIKDLKGMHWAGLSHQFNNAEKYIPFQKHFSLQNVQDLFLFSFLTHQRDAAARNLMVDARDENNLRLVMMDTEYCLIEDPRRFVGHSFAPSETFAFLTENQCFSDPITPDTAERILALDMEKLHKTLDKFYPDMHANDRKALENRVQFAKRFVTEEKFEQTCFKLWYQYGQSLPCPFKALK